MNFKKSKSKKKKKRKGKKKRKEKKRKKKRKEKKRKKKEKKYIYIIIIILPNNKIIDLIVSLLTAAYSINCRLFFYECTVVCTNLQITVHS